MLGATVICALAYCSTSLPGGGYILIARRSVWRRTHTLVVRSSPQPGD